MTHVCRSRSIVSLLALFTLALAGCKGGGKDGDAGTALAPATVEEPTPDNPPPPPPPSSQNRAPTISGSAPASASTGTAYSFQPNASDADGDALSFQIENKPAWAAFNTVTGQLSGTPGTSHAGVYANVRITVTDGQASSALPSFSITVSQPPTSQPAGSATLSWTAPTENTDGSALTNLAGFTIYYGSSSTALTQSTRIDNASVDTYVLQDLPAGTTYFAIKAFTTNGAESDLSAVVSKKIS